MYFTGFVYDFLLVSFFVSLTEARVIWTEGMSTESLQPHWAVGIFLIEMDVREASSPYVMSPLDRWAGGSNKAGQSAALLHGLGFTGYL